MRRQAVVLPVITTDDRLVKSTAERNKTNTSLVGEMFGHRTPNKTDVDPIPLPRFTMGRKPDDSDMRGVDLVTPLEELMKPRKVLQTTAEIEKWIYSNYHQLSKPMQYIGNEANTMDPALFEKADLRVLVVRLSSYDAVGGSMTHGAIAQSIS